MIIGKSKVIDWIRYNKTPYWRIKRSESEQHMVVSSGNEENIPIEESVSRLNQAFGVLSPGNYFIEAWEKQGQTKQWNRDHFQILPENQDYVGSAQLQQMMQQQTPVVDVAAEVEKALSKYKAEVELQELRRKCSELEKENKELQSSIESSIGRIWTRVEPYVGAILANQPGANVASIGSTGTQKTSPDEAQTRLEKAFEKWQETEPDPVTMIEKIAILSKTDPATYKMAKSFLTGK